MKTDLLRELKSTLPVRAYEPVPTKKRPFWHRPKKAADLPLVVTGAIGDNLLAIGLIHEIRRRVGKVTVYSDHPQVLAFMGGIDAHPAKEYPGFDYSLWVNSLPRFMLDRNFKGFRNDEIGDLYLAFKRWEADRAWAPYFARHPYLDNPMARLAVSQGLTRETLPYRILGIPYKRPWKVLPWAKANARYITVHDGYETALGKIGRATKTWHLDHWKNLVTALKVLYPAHQIVQLGGPTSRRIPGVDIDHVGKLNIRSSFEHLSRSDLHIDGDSGLVHAARMFGVPSIVMFGPTDLEFFGYAENQNLAPKECGGCWWLTKDWMQRCPLGGGTPACMDSIVPAHVLAASTGILHANQGKDRRQSRSSDGDANGRSPVDQPRQVAPCDLG